MVFPFPLDLLPRLQGACDGKNGCGAAVSTQSGELVAAAAPNGPIGDDGIPDHRVTRDRNFDIVGHVTAAVLDRAGVPTDADFYLCGPGQFVHDSAAALTARGVASDRVSTEVFGPSNSELTTASATDQAPGAGGADDSFAHASDRLDPDPLSRPDASLRAAATGLPMRGWSASAATDSSFGAATPPACALAAQPREVDRYGGDARAEAEQASGDRSLRFPTQPTGHCCITPDGA
jgi:hypothetical protein